MSRVYTEIPSNFDEIKNYFIIDQNEIIDKFFRYKKHYFYDTCSIIHHANTNANDAIINYLKENEAIIVITRTVLMELTKNTLEIHSKQVEYFQKLYQEDIPVLLIDEEMVLQIIKEPINIGNHEANCLLGYAIKEVSKSKTAIYNVMEKMDSMTKIKLLSLTPNYENLYDIFFQCARSCKKEGDSLAEELILILTIILTKNPIRIYKYSILSDDYKLKSSLISTRSYIKKQHLVTEPMQLTTPKLVYEMFKKKILINENDMKQILAASFSGKINVNFIDENSIDVNKKSFTKDELVDKFFSDSSFVIIY